MKNLVIRFSIICLLLLITAYVIPIPFLSTVFYILAFFVYLSILNEIRMLNKKDAQQKIIKKYGKK